MSIVPHFVHVIAFVLFGHYINVSSPKIKIFLQALVPCGMPTKSFKVYEYSNQKKDELRCTP
jgi:hypothetical protein